MLKTIRFKRYKLHWAYLFIILILLMYSVQFLILFYTAFNK